MNHSTVCTLMAASFCAALALASPHAMAAKPGGGGTTDPCATAVDFPAFAFWRPSGKGIEILVADANGKCIRSVIKSTGVGGTLQFSHLNEDATKGRIVWVDAAAAVAVDFTVAAATNQVSVGPRRTVYARTGGYISLSRDGNTLYSNNYLDTGQTVINRLRLDLPLSLNNPTPVFTSALDGLSFPASFSASGDETLLYADYPDYAGSSPIQRLVWIPLDESNAIHVIDSNNRQEEFSPGADPESSGYRVAYNKVVATSGVYCRALLTADTNGNPVNPADPGYAYGMKPTWVNGKILADGFAPTRSGCAYTGTIMRTDPDTGVQTALVSGYDPDGK